MLGRSLFSKIETQKVVASLKHPLMIESGPLNPLKVIMWDAFLAPVTRCSAVTSIDELQFSCLKVRDCCIIWEMVYSSYQDGSNSPFAQPAGWLKWQSGLLQLTESLQGARTVCWNLHSSFFRQETPNLQGPWSGCVNLQKAIFLQLTPFLQSPCEKVHPPFEHLAPALHGWVGAMKICTQDVSSSLSTWKSGSEHFQKLLRSRFSLFPQIPYSALPRWIKGFSFVYCTILS